MLAEFLKAGYVYQNKLFPTKSGTPQGGIISPILANHTLNGMEKLIKDNTKRKYGKTDDSSCPKVNMVRYADDFVITAKDEETAEKVKARIQTFMAGRGLRLSEEKTVITNIQKGFDFLGWNFRKYNGKLLIKPSEKSIKSVTQKLRNIIKANSGSRQDYLIEQLNPIIVGWSNYHQNAVSRRAFEKVDNIIYQKLWEWAKRRHPNKGHRWILERYWKADGNVRWVFKDNKTLKKMADKKIVRHLRLRIRNNPYIDREYFATRQMNLQANKMSGRYKAIWRKQEGKCPCCKEYMEDYKERADRRQADRYDCL